MPQESDNLIPAVHRTSDLITQCEDWVLSEIGLTVEQYRLLEAIESIGRDAKISDVARLTTRSANSVSMLADRMVKAHLLWRRRSKIDRRTVYLTPTEAGRNLLIQSSKAIGGLAAYINSQLPPKSRDELLTLLPRIDTIVSYYLQGKSQKE